VNAGRIIWWEVVASPIDRSVGQGNAYLSQYGLRCAATQDGGTCGVDGTAEPRFTQTISTSDGTARPSWISVTTHEGNAIYD
jgi:hypothetical protein